MNSDVTKNAIPNLFGSLKEIPSVDETLTKKGASADAKAVGDKFAEHRQRIDNIDPHFARNVEFDNADSDMEATNVQDAINELMGVKAPLDPPMAVGVEYLTAEKWLGKPVYAKIISIPWAAGTVHTIANFEGKQPHNFFGKVGTWTIPFMFQGRLDGDYSAVVTINKNNTDLKIGMYGGSNVSGTLELQLWYIKD